MLIEYKDLSKEQIEHLVNVFYQRDLVDPEKKYRYFFKGGLCEYAE